MSATFSPAPPLVPLHIDTSCPSPAAVRVTVFGEIDLATVDMLRDRLLRVLSVQRLHRIEIDLAGVSFMDCAGLGALIAVRNAALRAGCQLRIADPQPIVRRLLQLTGLLDLLTAAFDPPPLMLTRSVPAAKAGSASGVVTQQINLLVAA